MTKKRSSESFACWLKFTSCGENFFLERGAFEVVTPAALVLSTPLKEIMEIWSKRAGRNL